MHKHKRWRYYCDFCSKSGGHAGWMLIHEAKCFRNPNRICTVCEALQECQTDIAELLATLKEDIEGDDVQLKSNSGPMVIIPAKLRNAANECPACMLAAILQNAKTYDTPEDIPEFDFDFKKEMDWTSNEIRESENEHVAR